MLSINPTVEYDDNGNLATDKVYNSFSCDYRNRLNKVEDYVSSVIAEYTFDALGRRISKTVDGMTTYFIYDPQGRVIAEYEQDALKREFVYGNQFHEILGMYLAEHEGREEDWQEFLEFCEVWLTDPNDSNWNSRFDVVADNRINLKDFAYFASQGDMPSNNETRFYYLHDALGSIRGLIGGRFNRESDREFYNYDVYGKSTDTSAVGNPFRFAGYRYDAETGLYHTHFRTYDPETGRWLQPDPIGYADSWNLYEYVMGNPVMYSDPLGLKKYDLLHGYEDIKDFWENTNDQQRRQYFSKIQKEIGHLIDATAKKHCIPKLLLAGLIANELMDLTSYELDTVENSWFWNTVKGYNQSYGPAQIKPSTVLDLKLLGTDFQYYTITYEVILLIFEKLNKRACFCR
jgi:RHS repeat-associated protein